MIDHPHILTRISRLLHMRRPWMWVPSAYFAESMPRVVVMVLSVILYKQLGINNDYITLIVSLFYLPLVLRPFWHRLVGRGLGYRWWALAAEMLIALGLGGVAFSIPTPQWLHGTIFFFLLIAVGCAFHNVAMDRLCRYAIDRNRLIWTSSVRTLVLMLASIFTQGVIIMVVGNLQVIYRNSISYSWSLLFYGLTGLFLLLYIWHLVNLPRLSYVVINEKAPIVRWTLLRRALQRFFSSWRVVVYVAFVLLYVLPEALLSEMSTLFLIDANHNGGLGLAPQEYALAAGTVGVVALTMGSVLGNVVIGHDGLRPWILPMAFIFVVPTLLYVFLSYMLMASLGVVCLCIFLHQLGYGFGLTAYMQLIFDFTDKGTRASYHWSMAIMALSQMVAVMASGFIQQSLGYRHFFLFVLACSVITLTVTVVAMVTLGKGKVKAVTGANSPDGH